VSLDPNADPLADVVAGQYERWVYPDPILDLPGWLAHNWQWFDPSHSHRMLWPDRGYPTDLDILVAGCGTNQAAVFAYTNPTARVVAIDVSQASLDHHRYLADKYALKNLELHRLAIEDIALLGLDFDLIVSTGVLHHLVDPGAGMRALAERLRPEGVAAVMLYARYGRLGVEMMQSVFRELGLRQDSASLSIVRAAVASLSADHPVRSYLKVAPDVAYDAGLVDTFLHGRERAYTIDECRDLVESAGLVFQDIFLKSSYHAPRDSASEFFAAVAALPREREWSVMERINARNACHFFLACRPERPRGTYEITFAEGDPLRYQPALRYGCRLAGDVLHQRTWQINLDPIQAELVRRADGHKTIGQIVTAAASRGPLARVDEGALRSTAVQLFERLWQQDFVVLGIDPSA
jgi:SAM-dependent methyltransferase